MDAGSLAQMTYNNLPAANFGTSNSFSSRGKGNHIKRLSVAPPNGMGSINENEVDITPAPRTSRAHMLTGLRTAPKINTSMVPASAPHSQTRFSNDAYRGVSPPQNQYGGYQNQNTGQHATNKQMFTPQQVLAPPSLSLGDDDTSQMDPHTYNNLMMTNVYLAQRQQQLQQQLMNAQAAAQQFQSMNLNGQQQFGANPISGTTSFYNQQLQNGMQPVIQPVPGQPGLVSVFNPMTGQSSIYPESAFGQQQQHQQQHNNLPQTPATAGFQGEKSGFMRQDNRSPPSATANAWGRTFSPPRKTPSPPQDVAPLPEPSVNAYRPGHRRSMSSLNKTVDASKTNGPRSAGIPPTPIDGTFGLGLGRSGEHPTRQPRGPPPLDELVAAPTSKHEGSKNFATRQRRRALCSLVRAGNERRVSGRPNSPNGEASTPGSDNDTPVAFSSDGGDSDGTPATGSLSAHSSFGSLKAAAGAAIGSEVKSLKERSLERDTFARRLTSDSASSNEDITSGTGSERRRTPMLVLTSAEKRKSSMGSGLVSAALTS